MTAETPNSVAHFALYSVLGRGCTHYPDRRPLPGFRTWSDAGSDLPFESARGQTCCVGLTLRYPLEFRQKTDQKQ